MLLIPTVHLQVVRTCFETELKLTFCSQEFPTSKLLEQNCRVVSGVNYVYLWCVVPMVHGYDKRKKYKTNQPSPRERALGTRILREHYL